MIAVIAIPMVAAENDYEYCNRVYDDEWKMDACYWWEAMPATLYQREQIKEIMTMVLDHYFEIDISDMSPKEFDDVAKYIGPKGEWEALRLFVDYAQKKGFEIPKGIFDAPLGFDEILEISEPDYIIKREIV